MANDRVSMLVRLAPRTDYPPHRHSGLEELHLLHGELMINDRKLYPGDYNRAEVGTSDLRVWSETGCTCVFDHVSERRAALIIGSVSFPSQLPRRDVAAISWSLARWSSSAARTSSARSRSDSVPPLLNSLPLRTAIALAASRAILYRRRRTLQRFVSFTHSRLLRRPPSDWNRCHIGTYVPRRRDMSFCIAHSVVRLAGCLQRRCCRSLL
jgi:hypothetical protein